LPDDAEECFARAWDRNVGGEFSDAVRLLAIMTGQFDREISQTTRMVPRSRGERMEGTVKKWLPNRGFGFIAPAAGGHDVFVHVFALVGMSELREGQRVTFDEEPDPRTDSGPRSFERH
jgi:cold shock protein